MAENEIDANKLMKIEIHVKCLKRLTYRTKVIVLLLKLFADNVEVEITY